MQRVKAEFKSVEADQMIFKRFWV